MGLAGLFLLYRNDGDAQQAWHVLALAYPATKTLHTLLVLVPALAADATRRANAMGEWCVWMYVYVDDGSGHEDGGRVVDEWPRLSVVFN